MFRKSYVKVLWERENVWFLLSTSIANGFNHFNYLKYVVSAKLPTLEMMSMDV